MNIHALIDHLAVDLSSLFLRKHKFFRQSIDSPAMDRHIEAAALNVPSIAGPGHYEAGAATLAGTMNPAFRLAQWRGAAFPTIIYHHGSGENPYDKSFNAVFPVRKRVIPANLMVVRIPFNRTFDEYKQALAALNTYMAMLAVSVKLVDHLVRWSKSMGSGRIIVAGISLGGFVANLHHMFFNTAEVYRPVLAGVAMAELFLDSAYRALSSPLVLANADRMRALLNFDYQFSKVASSNVVPLMARYDQIVVFRRQARCYLPGLVSVMEKGHTTGVLAVKRLRRHLLADL